MKSAKEQMKSPYECDVSLIPWGDEPSSMTNEIAFEIGKGDFSSFYDTPVWSPNIEIFKYVKFFDWSWPQQGGGRRDDGEYYCRWSFSGTLREPEFNLEHKKYYIRGALASYAGRVTANTLSFCFANSFQKRDRIANWTDEILKKKFGGNKVWSIVRSDKVSIPGIASLIIALDKEAIDFLTND